MTTTNEGKFYSNLSNAKRAARRELGADLSGVTFTETEGRWSYHLTTDAHCRSAGVAPVQVEDERVATGKLLSELLPPDGISSQDYVAEQASEPEVCRAEIEAADDTGIPAFLRRKADPAELAAKRAAIALAAAEHPGARLKSPQGNWNKDGQKTRVGMADKKKGRTKIQIVGDLLLQAGGTTTKDILAATGWPAVSVPAMAKAARLTLRQEKNGKCLRYYGSRD
jgi:hypothetical protein